MLSSVIQIAVVQRKTIIIGVDDALKPVGRTSDHFAKFLSRKGTPCKVSKEDDNVVKLPLRINKQFAIQSIEQFVGERVKCPKCKALDTGTMYGTSKGSEIFVCFQCGNHRIDQ